MQRRIAFGSDHAGLSLKNDLVRYLETRDSELVVEDLGPYESASVDYPDFADKVVAQIKTDPKTIGILICGSGQGMAIRANRYPFIRAALCMTEEQASLSREHNDANILCLGARLTETHRAMEIVDTFLKTAFAGGRHQARVDKLSKTANC